MFFYEDGNQFAAMTLRGLFPHVLQLFEFGYHRPLCLQQIP